jgi:beta-lactam-binding protein with PASTA domain
MTWRHYVWILPFLFFVTGYYLASRVLKIEGVCTPTLIGMSLTEGISSLAHHRLYGQLIREVDDAQQRPGTIIDQSPLPGQLIREQQPVSLVVTRMPLPTRAPLVHGSQYEDAKLLCEQKHIRWKEHWIETGDPFGLCIAQYPHEDDPLIDHMIHLYFSRGETEMVSFPPLKGLSVREVHNFATTHHMKLQVLHRDSIAEDHTCVDCQVLEQKPSAGALVKRSERGAGQGSGQGSGQGFFQVLVACPP